MRSRHHSSVRFERIELRNFRSFGPETVTVSFPEADNLVACIGANNAGKSNLITGLRLALGGLRRFAPDPADFHQLDLAQEARIDLHLRHPLRRENVYRKTDEVRGFFFRAWRTGHGPDRGQLKTENYCLDADGKTYVPPAAVGRGSAGSGAERESVKWRPAPAGTVVRQLGRVHHLSPNLYRAFETTGLGVLAQLLDLYRDDFRAATNTYTVPDGEVVTRAEAYDRFAARLSEILRTEKLVEIETTLSENLRRVLGPGAAGAGVSIGLPTAEELLGDALSLHVQDDEWSPSLSVERLGAGYRSLLRLAVLRTYANVAADVRPAVFLVEEPEAYLNPHLRRALSSTLTLLAEQGNDVVLTTHDAAFVSLPSYRAVVRVVRESGRSHAFRCVDPLDFSYERVAQKMRRGGNSEVLFAAKAVLCEGQDDAAVVRALLDGAGIDADSLNVSVVDCGGRDQLPDYVRLLDALKIKLLVVTDGDASKIKESDDTAKKVADVAAVAGGRMFRFHDDLEAALGTRKQRDNTAHLVSLIEDLDDSVLTGDGEVSRCARALIAFVGSGQPREQSPPPG